MGLSAHVLDELTEQVDYGLTASARHSGNGPKFLRITDIQNGLVDWPAVPVCECELDQQEKYRLRPGDIVFARTGATTGKSYLIADCPDDTVFASYLIRVRPNNRVSAPYLAYFFQAPDYWEQVNRSSSGSAQPGVNATKLKNLRVPLPPLPEQERIVAILDEAFAAIATATANSEKNLANARELFESELDMVISNAAVSATKVALTDLATDITDGDHQPPPKSPDGIPFITISNIDKATRTIDFSSTFKVPQAYYDRLKPNRRPRNGDLLYTVTGSFGIPVVVDTNRDFCFQRHIGLIRPQEGVSTKWLYYLLLSRDVRMQVESAATGTAQKTVSLKALRALSVPKVPVSDQRRIVTILDGLARSASVLSSIYRQRSTALTELKQSILHKAFTGELTVDSVAADRTLSEAGV